MEDTSISQSGATEDVLRRVTEGSEYLFTNVRLVFLPLGRHKDTEAVCRVNLMREVTGTHIQSIRWRLGKAAPRV